MQTEGKVLLDWYYQNKRDLPWRKSKNPYYVWISEIMLQQTRVEAVKGYYMRFLEKLPKLEDLAKVNEDELLKLWEGLGYYSRARNLKKCAVKIMEEYDGKFPEKYKELLCLPGIGEYTAGAIASICFNEKVPAVDGNAIRVVMRLTNDEREIGGQKIKNEIFQKLQKLMPEDSGSFNQALMDLGATICIPNTEPRCNQCPLAEFCLANKEYTAKNIPRKSKKNAKKTEEYTIIIFKCQDKFAIQKRPSYGLLANLYEFYSLEGKYTVRELKNKLKKENIEYRRIKAIGESSHIFTHKIWNMVGYIVQVDKELPGLTWVNKEELQEEYSIPRAFAFYKNQL